MHQSIFAGVTAAWAPRHSTDIQFKRRLLPLALSLPPAQPLLREAYDSAPVSDHSKIALSRAHALRRVASRLDRDREGYSGHGLPTGTSAALAGRPGGAQGNKP